MIIVKTDKAIYIDVKAFRAGYPTPLETLDGLYVVTVDGWNRVVDCDVVKAKELLLDIINIITRSRNMANIIIGVHKGKIVLM